MFLHHAADCLTNLMFETPSDHTVEKIVITAQCVNGDAKPDILTNPEKKPARLKAPAKGRTTKRKVTA